MDSSSEIDLIEELADEFAERQQRGEKPTIGEYVERYPDLASEIRDVLPALVMMEQVVPVSEDLKDSAQDDRRTVQLKTLGDYRILREIGRGGMGIVYEAEQQALRRRVALKVLPKQNTADERSLERFQREARAAARMHHTNIVPVFDVGHADEWVFYAMQLIQGQGLDLVVDDLKRIRLEHASLKLSDKNKSETSSQKKAPAAQSIAASLILGKFQREDLAGDANSATEIPSRPDSTPPVASDSEALRAYAETVEQQGGSSVSAVLPGQSEISSAETNRHGYFLSVAQIGLQTARALSYAHARGIIHRDIKPANLLLDAAGTVWVTDFGLAKTGDDGMTHTGDILGTIRYMSPERFRGQCDNRADIYSLGLTLYEMLVLKPAFYSPDRLRLIEMVTKTEPELPRALDPKIPRDLETIVLKCIDKDARRRYQSADELADDLQRFVDDEPIKARRISLVERVTRWSRRNKALAASLAVAAGLLLIINIAGPLMTWRLTTTIDNLESTKRDLTEERDIAENLRVAAEEERELALEARRQAMVARKQALEQEELTQKNLYCAQINIADRLLQSPRANPTRMAQLLDPWRPVGHQKDLRGWEWHYLNSQQHSARLSLTGHKRTVRETLFSPDGKYLASAADREIIVWDAATGTQRAKLLGHTNQVMGLEWSPDSRTLASASIDNTVRLWDVPSADQIRVFELPGPCFDVAWNDERQFLAVASYVGEVSIISLESGETVQTLTGHDNSVWRISWSPNGNRLASIDFNSVRIWDAETGEEIHRQQLARDRNADDHSRRRLLHALAWSPTGKWIAAGGDDSVITILDGRTYEIVKLIDGHTDRVDIVAWSSDGSLLASACRDGTVHARNAKTWDLHKVITDKLSRKRSIGFSPNHRDLAFGSSNGSVQVWDIKSSGDQQSWQAHDSAVQAIVWSPEGGRLASVGKDRVLKIWDDSGEIMTTISDPVSGCCWNPNGSRVATTGPENPVKIWDAETGRLLQTLQQPADAAGSETSFQSVAWSADGRYLAGAGALLAIWDVDSGELVRQWVGHELVARSFQPRPGQSRPGLGGAGSRALASVAWSPDGTMLASMGLDQSARVWDTTSWNQLRELQDPTGAISCVSWSPDGKFLATGGAMSTGNQDWMDREGTGTSRIWNASTWRQVHELPGHFQPVTSMAWNPTGTRIASASSDMTVKVWDTDSGQEILTLDDHTPLATIAWDRDGLQIATAGNDKQIRIRDASPSYRQERSPLLLVRLNRRIENGKATVDDYQLRGEILARLGRWDEAAADFDQVAQMSGDEAPNWFETTDWVVGPFAENSDALAQRDDDPNRFVAEFAAGQDSHDHAPGAELWKTAETPFRAGVNLNRHFNRAEDIVFYAFTRCYVTTQQDAALYFGARNRNKAKLWLNGQFVQEFSEDWEATNGPVLVPAKLEQGWNTFLVKIEHTQGPNGLFLSLTDDPREVAQAATGAGQWETAVKIWSRLIEEDPENVEDRLARASVYFACDRVDEAMSDVSFVAESHIGDVTALLLQYAQKYQQEGDLRGSYNLLTMALRNDPDSRDLLRERTDTSIRDGQWRRAADDLARMIDLDPKKLTGPQDFHLPTELGVVLMKLGDVEGFRNFRSTMIERFGQTKDAGRAETVAKICMLLPVNDPDQLEVISRLAEFGIKNIRQSSTGLPWYELTMGMAEYRRGNYREAARWNDSAARTAQWRACASIAFCFQAMSQHHLGQTAEAKETLRSARALIDQFRQEESLPSSDWRDTLTARIAYDEAEALIGKTSP